MTGGNNLSPLPFSDVTNAESHLPAQLLFPKRSFNYLAEYSLPPNTSETSSINSNFFSDNFYNQNAISNYFPTNFPNGLTKINCTVQSLLQLKPIINALNHQLADCHFDKSTLSKLLQNTVTQIGSLLENISETNQLFCSNEVISNPLSDSGFVSFPRANVNLDNKMSFESGSGFITEYHQPVAALCLHKLRAQLKELNGNLQLVVKLLKELLSEQLTACLSTLLNDTPYLTWMTVSSNLRLCYK